MARKENLRRLEDIVKKLSLNSIGELQRLQSQCEKAGHPGEKVKYYHDQRAVCECQNCFKQYERKLTLAEYDTRKPFSHSELYRA
jgi:hypothetical protein